MKVLIIDDETIVRTGLKKIIDWKAYDFDICDESDNGEEGLRKILFHKPDLVLLDIKMPGMYGVEVAKRARKNGFKGKIIILSGYSDFEYAHEAIKSGVDAYLLKPIEEDELIEAVLRVKGKLEDELTSSVMLNKSLPHMKNKIINDIICGRQEAFSDNTSDELSLYNVDLKFDVFQVAVIENLAELSLNESKFRNELLREYSGEASNIDTVSINDKIVILLKGGEAVRQLPIAIERMTAHDRHNGFHFFIGVGRCVESVSDIFLSYRDARKLSERRFFYDENQIMVFWNEDDEKIMAAMQLSEFNIGAHVDNIKNYLEIGDYPQVHKVLSDVKDSIRHMDIEPEKAITLLTNIYTQVKKKIQQVYPNVEQGGGGHAFKSDIQIMDSIYGKTNLFEIIKLFEEEFRLIAEEIGNLSGKNLIKKLEHYISVNYDKDLKLESIAQIFGYNRGYLGKIFKTTYGESFNAYLDKVRIGEAKRMLLNENLKVYEISEKAGFGNIDYFYKKFKHYVGQSPKEYRRDMGITTESA